VVITPERSRIVHDFVIEAEQKGLRHVLVDSSIVRASFDDLVLGHVAAFRTTFLVSGLIALVGAVVCSVFVRKQTRILQGPVFGRRSRGIVANASASPGLTRMPPDAR